MVCAHHWHMKVHIINIGGTGMTIAIFQVKIGKTSEDG